VRASRLEGYSGGKVEHTIEQPLSHSIMRRLVNHREEEEGVGRVEDVRDGLCCAVLYCVMGCGVVDLVQCGHGTRKPYFSTNGGRKRLKVIGVHLDKSALAVDLEE